MSDKRMSLLDLEGARDVIIKLLDMIESAIGWTLTPKGSKKDFEEAIVVYKKAVLEDDTLSGVEKAAKVSEARKELKQYINEGKIISYASQNIRDEAKLNIEDDWLMYFFEYAKNISDEKVQRIWGKILAEQCNGDTSINRKLIHCLSLLDSETALAFGNLCTVTIDFYDSVANGILPQKGSSHIPFVVEGAELIHFLCKDVSKEIQELVLGYSGKMVSSNQLCILEEIGLIEYSETEKKHFEYTCNNRVLLTYGNQFYQAYLKDIPKYERRMDKTIKIGAVKYTSVGEKLYKILKMDKCPGLEIILKDYLEKQGWILEEYGE